jgi:predicted Zn-dependent protease
MYQLVVDYKAAAQQASQRLAKKAPNSEFTRAIRAEVLADGDRFDEAIGEFKEVMRKNPEFPGIHLALGHFTGVAKISRNPGRSSSWHWRRTLINRWPTTI